MNLRCLTISSKFLRHSRSFTFRSLSTDSEKPSLFERELYHDTKVVRLVLNAPKTRNSLSLALIESLFKELQEIDAIEKIRAVIIAGKGPAFSAGHDLKELVRQRVGLFCSTPGIPLVRNIPKKIAMDMLLTGRSITAEEALRAGLVSRISKEGEEPRIEALKVAEEICKFSRSVTALGKTFFYTQVELSQRDAYSVIEEVDDAEF
uniref:Uncharacterized protein n=1 Tax=Panagrolaimus sp. ES5 TaxID=591445 RepID=A0AC34FDP7_9BILA